MYCIYLQYTPSVWYYLHTLFWYRHKHMTFPPPDIPVRVENSSNTILPTLHVTDVTKDMLQVLCGTLQVLQDTIHVLQLIRLVAGVKMLGTGVTRLGTVFTRHINMCLRHVTSI